MQMIVAMEKNLCTGCGVCMNACPNECITMEADEGGFLFPSVDMTLCSGCGKCAACCPVLNPPAVSEKQGEPNIYSAWSLDESIRYDSTSGGIFTELAKAVIQQGGYVAGAKYNEKHLVEHAIIMREEDIPILRQSKYLQSETKAIYKQIETLLQTEKPILFVGTPCQCAGLKVFLSKQYGNLILCDFICRGVNSPKVYLKYLEELELKFGSSVKRIWFKNKTYGWNNFCTKITFEDGQEYLGGRDTDPFMYGYIKQNLNLYMRPSCGDCKFKGIRRPVDITLGDFWGAGHEHNSQKDYGISAVMLHSPCGMNWFYQIRDRLFWEKRKPEELLPGNPCLIKSAGLGNRSAEFYSMIDRYKFSEAVSRIRKEEQAVGKTPVNLKRSGLCITKRCTLKCKLCGSYMPYYENPKDLEYDILAKIIDEYFSVVDTVGDFSLTGGEPMMHKDLGKIIAKVLEYRNQIEKLLILTNGTLLPNTETLDLLKENRELCQVTISHYGEVSCMADQLKELLYENQIPCRIIRGY